MYTTVLFSTCRRTYEHQMAEINGTFLSELRSLNATWEKKLQKERLDLVNELKAQFEAEKAQIVSSLHEQHDKDIQ